MINANCAYIPVIASILVSFMCSVYLEWLLINWVVNLCHPSKVSLNSLGKQLMGGISVF